MKDEKIYRGDIYLANLNPYKGSEQGGKRPVIIIQNDVGNHYSPTVIVTAVTSRFFKKRALPIIARHNWITLVLLTISIIVTYVVQKQKAKYEYSLKRSLTTDERRIEYNKSTLLDRFLAKDIRYSGAFPLIKQFYHDKTNSYSKKLFKKSKKLFLYNQAVSLIQLSIVFAVMVSFGKQLFYGSMTYGDYTMSVNVSMSFRVRSFVVIETHIFVNRLSKRFYGCVFVTV